MAQSAKERKAAQRARDKLKEEERIAALMAYKLSTPVFKGTAARLERIMSVAGLDERDDAITRMIHYLAQSSDEHIKEALKAP